MTVIDEKIKKEFESLPDNFWDFKFSTTHDLTHGLHSYPAMMVYPISRNIIRIYKKYQPIETLLDPFMGSGTVLVEGMLGNIPTIYGVDLNPLAVLMSEVKTTPLSLSQLESIESHKINLSKIKEQTITVAEDFDKYIREEQHLDITAKNGWGDSANQYIDAYFRGKNKNYNYQYFTNLGFWFLPKVIIQLQTIKNFILRENDVAVRKFLFLAFSETVRTTSNTRNSEFKLFRMPAEKLLIYNPNAFEEYLKILNRNIDKMKDFVSHHAFNSSVHVNYDDTRFLKTVPDHCVDLVITSPPYGDSRTTVAYGQFSRLSMQWLGLDGPNSDTNDIDKTLLGGKPYCNKQQWALLGSQTLTETLGRIAERDLFRADDVFSFYIDLDKCLHSISNKMKVGGYLFWVVGNRTVKLQVLQTDKILSEMAKKYGLKYLFSFGRNISNKTMPSLNSPSNEPGLRVRTMTKEIIVVLKKE